MKRILLLTSIVILLATSCSNTDEVISNIEPVYDISLNFEYNDLVLEDENLSKSNFSIKLNDKVVDSNDVVLETSNNNIEIIDNKIVAKEQGKATITATYKDIVKTQEIEVFKKETYTSILDESMINYYGRIDTYKDKSEEYVMLDNTASGFDVNLLGDGLSIVVKVEGYGRGSLKVYVDEKEEVISLTNTSRTVVVANNLENKVHRIKALKMGEQSVQRIKLYALKTKGTFLNKNDKPTRKFEFYGDSITCGYGTYNIKNEYTNDTDGSNSYVTMLGNHYNAEISCISHSGIAAAFRRDNGNYLMKEVFDCISIFNQKKYDYSKYQADIVFINLGTNDSAFKDKYNATEMTSKYLELITSIREKQPNAYMFCMYGMMGKSLTVEDDIINAVHEFKNTIDNNIGYYYIEANIEGTGNHPDALGHKKAYEQIVKIIDKKNILSKGE